MSGTTLTQAQMTAIAQTSAGKLRIVRQAITPVIGQAYVDSVLGHKVENAGKTLIAKSGQRLRPLQIWRSFRLELEQLSDSAAMQIMIAAAAADLAQAEDAVILLGRRAKDKLDTLDVIYKAEDLDEQEGLFDPGQAPVRKPILDSIVDGIEELQSKKQGGDYYVVVSPELYGEAFKNHGGISDAPIYQIQPLLASQGFLCSHQARARSGVIFSLARGTISLSVPMDTYVDTSIPNDDEGRPRFRLAEQLRLIIDDRDAVAALT